MILCWELWTGTPDNMTCFPRCNRLVSSPEKILTSTLSLLAIPLPSPRSILFTLSVTVSRPSSVIPSLRTTPDKTTARGRKGERAAIITMVLHETTLCQPRHQPSLFHAASRQQGPQIPLELFAQAASLPVSTRGWQLGTHIPKSLSSAPILLVGRGGPVSVDID